MRGAVVSCLQGGLGNQLFQYAMARSLSIDYGLPVFFDRRLGFFLNSHDKRNFLPDHPKRCYELGPLVPLRTGSFILDLVTNVVFRTKLFDNALSLLDYKVYREDATRYTPITLIGDARKHLVPGYWESHLYFQHNFERIYSEFESAFIHKVIPNHKIHLNENIGLGIRLREGTPDPESLWHKRKRKTVADWELVIDEMLTCSSTKRITLYTTQPKHPLIEHLKSKFPIETVKRGNAIEDMFKLAQHRHMILSSSTYYWWSAYFSNFIFGAAERQIAVADNVFNQDSYLPSWKLF